MYPLIIFELFDFSQIKWLFLFIICNKMLKYYKGPTLQRALVEFIGIVTWEVAFELELWVWKNIKWNKILLYWLWQLWQLLVYEKTFITLYFPCISSQIGPTKLLKVPGITFKKVVISFLTYQITNN